jgi:hypothetical protein
MQLTRSLPALAFCLAIAIPVRAQDAKAAADLEAKFKETFTGATMQGRWCSLKDGVLGPEKDEKYVIESVAKMGGDDWVFHARIRYAKQEIVAPIPVKVKWAGDTAVITVDDMKMPGGDAYGGTAYTARVLVFGNTYAGTWSGGNHGGLMNGVITKTGADTK